MRHAYWILLLAACGGPAPPRLPASAERVVSLLPAFTEVVVALGRAERLVGCTEYCRPGRDVARLPWRDAAAAEPVLRARPDLVLRQKPRGGDDPLKEALERAGVPVVWLPSETTADVREAIREIGARLGARERATAYVREFDAALVAARARARGKPAPKVLFVFQRDAHAVANVMAAGPGSFLDELIGFAGGRNALARFERPYVSLRLEQVVRIEADLIIDGTPGAAMAAWDELDHIPPVRAARDSSLLIPGPRLPRAVERMVELIHGRP